MASKNQNVESLFVMIELPDNRKRFSVFYEKNENEKEGIVLMIPANLSFSGFLGLLISKFKLDSTSRSHIRVRENGNGNGNGRRIKSLTGTYNNQILYFTISALTDEEPEDMDSESSLKSLTTSQEYQEQLKKLEENDTTYLQLFKDENENGSQFLSKILKPLLDKHSNQQNIIIGESYPYRFKLLISDHEKDSKVWLYFIDSTKQQGELEYSISVITECNSKSNTMEITLEKRIELANSEISKLVNQIYQQNKLDILSIIESVTNYYKKEFKAPLTTGFLDESVNLFPDMEKLKTVSQNKLLDTMYTSIQAVSNHYNVPQSLARKLLFKNQWDEKLVISQFDQSNIKAISFPHKSKNIGLFKFNSIIKCGGVDESAEEECSICYCEYEPSEMVELICGHRYCGGCMSSYFNSSVEDGNGGSVSISCPTVGCMNKCIDEVTIESLLLQFGKQKVVTSLISENLIRDVIYSTTGNHICPHDNCGRVLMGMKKNTKSYAPYIGCFDHTFCLFCKKEGLHWPVNCSKPVYNDGDLYTYKWIIQNTTICTKCKFPIEKSSGCNHMTCSRCRHSFCYSCGSDYGKCANNNGYCYGASIDENNKNRQQIFFNTMNQDVAVDSSFMESFFNGQFNSRDPLVKHIYQSLVTLITERNYGNKKHLLLLQNAVFFLHVYNTSLLNSKEQTETLASCQKTLKKLLRPEIMNAGIQTYFTPNSNKDNGPPVRSLSVTLCHNGSKKQLTKLFVQSKFNEFKNDIATQLNKLIPMDQVEYDGKKLRIYNLYGGQIKSSNEIIDNEPVFITASINEPWIEPQYPALTPDEILAVEKQIEHEKQQEVTINIGNGKQSNTFTHLAPKEKTNDHKLKLKEKLNLQIALQEKLKLDQTRTESEKQGIRDSADNDIRDQYYYYRNSLVDSDNEDGDDDNQVGDGKNGEKSNPAQQQQHYEDEEEEYDSYEEDYDEDGDDYEDELNDQIYKQGKDSKNFW